jgi:hypothetical protein
MNQVVRFHDQDQGCHESPHSLGKQDWPRFHARESYHKHSATAALTILLKRVVGELIDSGLGNCLQLTRFAITLRSSKSLAPGVNTQSASPQLS